MSAQAQSWHFIQKQILLGNAGTGKSSLLVRLTDDRFLNHSEPTIGVEFGSRLVKVDDDKLVKLQIWDTAGQERFKAITRSYARGAQGALLAFDLSDRESFIGCKEWLNELREWGEPDVVVLLVGNKGDLCEDEDAAPASEGAAASPAKLQTRAVSRAEATAWADSEGLSGYIETSAKTGKGVIEAFDSLTREAHKIHQAGLKSNQPKRGSSTVGLTEFASSATKGCC